MKLSENKLKEKLDSHLIQKNCTEIRPPVLNVETVEKGNLDRTARKNDARLLDVQKLITTATAALVNASDQLHFVTTAFADQSTRGGEQQNPSRFVEAANEMLATNGLKCSMELVLTLHNLAHTVHVQPARRQRCPVACRWTLCYERPDGTRSQHLPGSTERNQQ